MPSTQADHRKSAILAGALRVIIDVGLTDLTIAQVASAAGVSTALVHYHFSSRDDLILAAMVQMSDTDKAWRNRVVAGRGTVTARLDEILCGSLPTPSEVADWLLWIEAWSEIRRDGRVYEVMVDQENHELEMVRVLINAGNDAGEFTCADPGDAAARLMALRDGLAVQQTLYAPDRPAEYFGSLLRGAIRNNLGMTEERYLQLVPDLASPAALPV